MEHRPIGSLSVSVVGLGCNQLGTQACDDATSIRVVTEALENGITFFDTSDEYGRDYANPGELAGWGHSEELLGRALAGHRDEAVIATKFGPCGPVSGGVDATGLDQVRSRASAEGVRLAVEESLQRLGTDRIDLYQLHFPDPRHLIDETLKALQDLVREGKVLEIGCANFDSDALHDAADAADKAQVGRFVSVQNQFNLFYRRPLTDSMPACDELQMAFLPYYPLASGILTGKYQRGQPVPPGTRLADQVSDELRAKMLSARTFDRLDALATWAAERGHSVLELAYAWLLGQPRVASVIAGASKPAQVASNAAAATWVLSPAEVGEVTDLVAAAA